ncbi:hypothetical protein A2U01_0081955, partial [Trifolium medium]|nr:hypothetical protein [Trifolium medium]
VHGAARLSSRIELQEFSAICASRRFILKFLARSGQVLTADATSVVYESHSR